MEIPDGSKSYKARNPHIFKPDHESAAKSMVDLGFIEKPSKRIRQSVKPTLNKLETEFAIHVLSKEHPNAKIRAQAVTLKLANGVRYNLDFFVFDAGIMIAYEVKGPHAWDDAIVKLKVAAAAWPEIKFNLAWKDKKLGWRGQPILP